MDKLTTEQKAKRYDEVIEKLRSLHDDYDTVSTLIDIKEELENIFPELKESEGERIRKEIVRFIQMEVEDEIVGNKWLAWLEKQGEQNLIMADSPQLGEQKPIDKIESKFKVGDWVVDNRCGIVKQVEFLEDDGYEFFNGSWVSYEDADKYFHLWSIQDAKDGDVLFHSDSASNGIFIFKEILQCGTIQKVVCYCDYDSEDHFCLGEHHTCCWTDAKILYPATKEQRDLLFQKMKEAGYSFDFERKELKKLGHSEVTKTSDQEEIAEIPFGAKDSELQEATYFIPKGFHAEIDDDKVVIKKDEKPTAWSEEDERNMQNIDSVLFYDKKLPEDTCVKLRNFLKTLKERIEG